MSKPIDPTKGDGALAVDHLAVLRTKAAEIRKTRKDDTGPPAVANIAAAQREIRELRRRVMDLETLALRTARLLGLLMDPDDDDKAGTE